MFVSRLSSDASTLVWSTYFSDNTTFGNSTPTGMGLAQDGSVIVSGGTASYSFPTTPGAYQTHIYPPSAGSGFLSRFSHDGTSLLYSTYSPASGAPVIDASGMVTVFGTAYTSLGTRFTPGAFDTTVGGPADLYVARFTPQLDKLLYASALGGTAEEYGGFGGLDARQRAVLAGRTMFFGDFPTTPGAYQPNYAGGQSDIVVGAFDLVFHGVSLLGASSPTCTGPITINTTKFPGAGDAAFRIWGSGAPPRVAGLILLGEPSQTHTVRGGAAIWIDLAQPHLALPVLTDDDGYLEFPLPLPGNAHGRVFAAQLVFRNPGQCAGTGLLAASQGLLITVE